MTLDRYETKLRKVNGFKVPSLLEGIISENESYLIFKKLTKKKLEQLDEKNRRLC